MLNDFRKELLTISAAVMGIEFAYAAETAFVSPTLLKIGEKKSIKCSKRSHIIISCLGVSQSHMTLIWCLSPLVGFFLTPILGSLSDRYCIHILALTGAQEVVMSIFQCFPTCCSLPRTFPAQSKQFI